MTTKNFKISSDGVLLFFSKAFDAQTKGLKVKLWKWYLKVFQFTRCDFDKNLDIFTVFFRDAKAKSLREKLLWHWSAKNGQGIDLLICLAGDLVGRREKFVGAEHLCRFDGLTSLVYDDFFIFEAKSLAKAVHDENCIQSIVNAGKIATKYPISDILIEWHNPVPVPGQDFLGGVVK